MDPRLYQDLNTGQTALKEVEPGVYEQRYSSTGTGSLIIYVPLLAFLIIGLFGGYILYIIGLVVAVFAAIVVYQLVADRYEKPTKTGDNFDDYLG